LEYTSYLLDWLDKSRSFVSFFFVKRLDKYNGPKPSQKYVKTK